MFEECRSRLYFKNIVHVLFTKYKRDREREPAFSTRSFQLLMFIK